MEFFLDIVANAYEWFWMNTTGRPYTDIFREDPRLFAIPAFVVLVVTARVLPRRHWARTLIIYLSFGIGFVGGHVFW